MKTLNLDVKLLESTEDLDNLQRGDVIQIYLSYDQGTTEIYYQGLAIYSEKNYGHIKFIELGFPSEIFSVVCHRAERNSLEVVDNSVYNLSRNKINRVELSSKDKTYRPERDLLLGVLRKGRVNKVK